MKVVASLLRSGAYCAGWLLILVITALSIVPATLRPETNTPHAFEHFAIFWLTGLAFGLSHDRRPAAVMAALVVFSAAIEVAQNFVPSRHARVGDFVVDALGACVGVAIASMIARARTRKPRD